MNSSLQDKNASNALLMLFYFPQYAVFSFLAPLVFIWDMIMSKDQKAFSEGNAILRIVPIFFLLCPPSHLPLKNSPFFLAGSLCQTFSLPDFWEAL